ncbi:G-alpha-domain-containing protein [Flagelloscypha sp. PMI_526]|nr:G-alpha-domain-containing protein [Flagelloscypha sp. PMI_526]
MPASKHSSHSRLEEVPVVHFPPAFNHSRPGPNGFFDPFEKVLQPPDDETPHEREVRTQQEDEARRVSDQIDQQLKLERDSMKRGRRKVVRLLLLGQSESGKSTTLRQFQRLYTPTQFRAERILWRAVIQLNIVRSILCILNALENSPNAGPMLGGLHRTRSHATQRSISSLPSPTFPPPLPTSPSRELTEDTGTNGTNGYFAMSDAASSRTSYSHSPPPSHMSGRRPSLPNSGLPPEVNAVRPILASLKDVENLLIARLSPESPDTQFTLPRGEGLDLGEEITIRANPEGGWKGALQKFGGQSQSYHSHLAGLTVSDEEGESSGDDLAYTSSGSGTMSLSRTESSAFRNGKTQRKGKAKFDPNDPQSLIHSLRKEMKALWNCQEVRDILERKKVRVWEEPGFFLNDLDRVASMRYMPTDEDVLRARLKTVGVAEYKFEMEASAGRDSATEWRIVDVGGSRMQRPTWVPFFEDVDAIIFLAPISGFDQVLPEDKTVNRLEDSVLLWKALCSNKLLANVDLVLFLNKCDILEMKLNSGVHLVKYLKSYGDRPNDLDNVSKYLRSKFSAIQREYSPQPRKFYVWCTSVTDTATTAGIIASVRDMVIRQHLKHSKLL